MPATTSAAEATARLSGAMAIGGVSRRRHKVYTTRADPQALRAADLVNRDFTAARPNALRTTDLTYVPTRSPTAYLCFIVDAFSRMILRWRVATHMRTSMVADALEMARRSRGAGRLVGLVTHAGAGSQFTSVRLPERLDEILPATIATAAVDRFMHHAHIVVTEGDSYRFAQARDGKGVTPLT